ncbi:hypothetical protein CL628_00540 [bacterium]|nr:hypothetical protein [bacterium]
MISDKVRQFMVTASSWLLLVAAASVLAPIPLSVTFWASIVGTILVWLSVARKLPDFVVPAGLVILIALAFWLPIPWPDAVPTAVQLGLSVGIWGILATIGTAAILLRHE